MPFGDWLGVGIEARLTGALSSRLKWALLFRTIISRCLHNPQTEKCPYYQKLAIENVNLVAKIPPIPRDAITVQSLHCTLI